MAKQTIQVADKPTLDEIKALLENSGYGLEAIKNALGGGGIHVEGMVIDFVNNDINTSTLPYEFSYGWAVVLNGEIHILGNQPSSSYVTNHYKWNGTSWESVSTLPYAFSHGSAVVYNDEIHILGGYYYNTYYRYHYKWNGNTWESVSTLPYDFSHGWAVVYNDEIHILGGDGSSNYTNHYKWNGTSWTSVSTLPYDFSRGSAVVYNDEIHILGSGKYHYKVKNNSNVYTMNLPKGKHIMCSQGITEIFAITSNLKKIKSNVLEVTEDGLVQFYLTIYALTESHKTLTIY